jgi:hypothetical protein
LSPDVPGTQGSGARPTPEQKQERRMSTEEIYQRVAEQNPNQPEFLQAVQEVFESLAPVIEKHPEYRKAKILERVA